MCTSIFSERQTEQDFFSLDTKTVALRKHLCTQHMQIYSEKERFRNFAITTD